MCRSLTRATWRGKIRSISVSVSCPYPYHIKRYFKSPYGIEGMSLTRCEICAWVGISESRLHHITPPTSNTAPRREREKDMECCNHLYYNLTWYGYQRKNRPLHCTLHRYVLFIIRRQMPCLGVVVLADTMVSNGRESERHAFHVSLSLSLPAGRQIRGWHNIDMCYYWYCRWRWGCRQKGLTPASNHVYIDICICMYLPRIVCTSVSVSVYVCNLYISIDFIICLHWDKHKYVYAVFIPTRETKVRSASDRTEI